MNSSKQTLLAAVVAAAALSVAFAPFGDRREFTFTDPKRVNSASWLVDSPLEPIQGVATVVEGTIQFDPENPEATTGKIVIPTSSLKSPVEGMTGHLISSRWLDAEKFPTIEFVVKRVVVKSFSATPLTGPDEPTTNGYKEFSLQVTGDFSLHGVTKSLTIPVAASYMPEGLTQKMGRRLKGDLVRIRADFSINRADFGIDGGVPITLVGPKIEIRCSVAAVAQTE